MVLGLEREQVGLVGEIVLVTHVPDTAALLPPLDDCVVWHFTCYTIFRYKNIYVANTIHIVNYTLTMYIDL